MDITQCNLVYFSSVSENTHRFVQKLGVPATRIPLHGRIEVDEPYVLILPTYGGGRATPDINVGGYVPKQVIAFLNNEHNRSFIRGVIAAGNNNFGTEFAYAGNVVSRKCGVPYLYRFELMGTPDDVDAFVNEKASRLAIVEASWCSASLRALRSKSCVRRISRR